MRGARVRWSSGGHETKNNIFFPRSSRKKHVKGLVARCVKNDAADKICLTLFYHDSNLFRLSIFHDRYDARIGLTVSI